MMNGDLAHHEEERVELLKSAIAALGDGRLGWEAPLRAICQKALEDPEGPVFLAAAIADKRFNESFLRMEVMAILRDLKDPRTVPFLISILEQQEISWIVIETLGGIGDARAIPCLQEVLKREAYSGWSEYAITALGDIGDPAGIDALAEALSHDWTVAEQAVLALAKIRHSRAREVLFSAEKLLRPGASPAYATLLKVLETIRSTG